MSSADVVHDGPLLSARGLSISFKVRRGPIRSTRVHAVDDVSIDLYPGETFGLLGESGSGKSTLGRLLLHLTKADTGTLTFRGRDMWAATNAERRRMRRRMQMVFQDPFSSFDPSVNLLHSMREPLQVHERLSRDELDARIAEVVTAVGLSERHLAQFPRQLSGGQLQRLAIARALSLKPDIVVLDEPVSALDMSTQAQVVNLLSELQAAQPVTYLFISHNPSIVHHISHRVGVMRRGQLVEVGDADQVHGDPQHPYTQRLFASQLSGDPKQRRRPVSRISEMGVEAASGRQPT
ncbi:ATP-binding cassette domain-containing protein [Saccharomonospora sp. NPDC046836]|uniref:ATP-binding cassette domain-containing protein n=1 Tax=Saccharomonospora sp. NPDC046836 TaxID=3156921 RepID=UPI003404503F